MKKLLLLALGAVLGVGAVRADDFNLRDAGKLAHRSLVDWYERDEDSDKRAVAWAPDVESFTDLATFFASHSTSPAALRAAHMARIGTKTGGMLGNARKTAMIVNKTDSEFKRSVSAGTQAAGTAANIGHGLFYDIPDSLRAIRHASPLATRNQSQSTLAEKSYTREKYWQIALTIAHFLTAWSEREALNTHREEKGQHEGNYALYRYGWLGTLRNLLRLWQQARLSNYYQQNLAYALHPEKEQAAIQAQLDEKEKKRLRWEERKQKLGAFPGNVWHFLREKGFDPVATFGKEKWDDAVAFVQGLLKKEK